MQPLSNDLRERILAAVDNREGSRRQLAVRFVANVSTITRLLQLRRETGSFDPPPHGGGKEPTLDQEGLDRLRKLVHETPDATLEQLQQSIGAGILRGLSPLKLGLLAAIAVWGFGLGSWSNSVFLVDRPPDAAPLAPSLVGGLVAASFSLAGWWDVNKIAGEVRDPGLNLPRALMLGVGLVMISYIVISSVF